MASSKVTEVANLKTIEAALKLVDTKKESLKRAFDDLQAHSSLLSSFSLSWPDLDSHFTSLQTTLTRRFRDLQSLNSSSSLLNNPPRTHDPIGAPHDPAASDQSLTVVGGPLASSNPHDHGAVTRSKVELPVPVQDPSSSNPTSQSQTQTQGVPVQDPSSLNQATWPELGPLCEKMDGPGLRDYISDHAKEREAIRTELVGLMGASDPGAMVLDAMEGFYSSNSTSKGDKDMDLYRLRKSCLDLLEVLTEIKPNLSDEVKERAKKLAFGWKEKVNLNGDSPLEALGFLNLIVAYGLENEFDVGELLNYFVVVARFKHATVLCRSIGLGDKTTDLVQKLIDNGKQLLAVKFIFEFGLTDKFKPVPLLEDHLQECKEFTNKICKDGKNSIKAQNEARAREVNALKSVLKVIDEHKLKSEYPRLDLEKRIEMLEKQKADKKVDAQSPE
ncbi:hypothetical protein GH714_023395 [Hevea brasiliensis]|uniref:FRIGIDA-like protein n=1 Tax=Hevea brasiliensis TaxID=3981 RepID=A0A6A6LQR3_HEVBR|nr:hypothetical protein GH714_023395 [Hevea brasiliensis]